MGLGVTCKQIQVGPCPKWQWSDSELSIVVKGLEITYKNSQKSLLHGVVPESLHWTTAVYEVSDSTELLHTKSCCRCFFLSFLFTPPNLTPKPQMPSNHVTYRNGCHKRNADHRLVLYQETPNHSSQAAPSSYGFHAAGNREIEMCFLLCVFLHCCWQETGNVWGSQFRETNIELS